MRELRFSVLWWTLGLLLVAVVWLLSLTPRPPNLVLEYGDKLGHLAAYGAQVAWFGWIFPRHRLWWVALLFLLQGALLEGLQGMFGYRQSDLYDIAANSIGVGIGMVIAAVSGGFLVWLETRLSTADPLRES